MTTTNDTNDVRRGILVLGMHRSGTSAMMGLLQRLGVHLGGSLMQATRDNEKGYFENLRFTELNEQILQFLGAGWDIPKAFPPQWWQSKRLTGFEKRLRELIRAELAHRGAVGLKDPRISRLLPLYQKAATAEGLELGYVIMLRHPAEVAASLKKRDGIVGERAVLLWLLHTLEAELYTRGSPRLFITYEGLLTNWREAIGKVVQTLGIPLEKGAAIETAEEFISGSLRHHDSSALSDDGLLLQPAREIYQALGQGDASAEELLDRRRASLLELLEVCDAAGICRTLEEEEDAADAFAGWMAKKALPGGEAQTWITRLSGWRHRPAFHLIIPVFAGQEEGLAKTFDSLCAQVYSGWGLSIIATGPAPADASTEGLEHVEWLRVPNPLEAVATVANESQADWIAVIEPGTLLEPHALLTLGDYAQIRPQWGFVYCDEDVIGEEEEHFPLFKPDFNLDLARSKPYFGGLAFIRRDGLGAMKLRAIPPRWWIHDMALQSYATYGERGMGHIADILARRPAPTIDDGELFRGIVAGHIGRLGVRARVLPGYVPESARVVYLHDTHPLVSIIIPNKDKVELLRPCLESLVEKTSYPNFEVIIVDNGSTQEETLLYYRDASSRLGERLTVLSMEGPFNFSAMNNRAVEAARGEYVVLLNNDTEIVQAAWLERLMHHAQRPEVGIVGARLAYPGSGKVQHAGVVLGLLGPAEHIFIEQDMNDPGYMERALVDQNYSAVTAACFVVRKSVYEEVGGLDEEAFKVSYNDVDFCIRVGQRGYQIVWTPFAIVVHHGSMSQTTSNVPQTERVVRFQQEQCAMYERWLPLLAQDPAYNRNLSLVRRDARVEGEVVAYWNVDFHDKLRIVGQPLSRSAIGDLRVIGPLNALAHSGMAQCVSLSPIELGPGKLERVPSLVEIERLKPDVLLLQSVVRDHYLAEMEKYHRFSSAFRIYDLEDLKLDGAVPESNPQKRHLPRDMGKRLKRALSYCDRLLVSSEVIAEAHSGDISDIRVVPNYLSKERWGNLTSQRRAGRKPRVGWAGAQQHHGDLQLLIPVLEATADEIEWVIFGMCIDELRPYVKELHEFARYEEYPAKLASLNLDLAVAPLAVNAFNQAKSNLRLLEFGICGWPVVCTDIEPYRGAPVKRVRNEPRAWLEAIRERTADLDAAAREGDELRKWVVANYMLEDHLGQYLEALRPN